ncbi:hypothetical protein NL676_002780 [Syzygium grande]|nr:hypothetical protein NL676_002780 [Syzygium grande]
MKILPPSPSLRSETTEVSPPSAWPRSPPSEDLFKYFLTSVGFNAGSLRVIAVASFPDVNYHEKANGLLRMAQFT